jgi:hypothetical protein
MKWVDKYVTFKHYKNENDKLAAIMGSIFGVLLFMLICHWLHI